MNGLQVNLYHSSYESHNSKKSNHDFNGRKDLKKTRHYTWPRKRMSSRKYKVSRVISQIKSDGAISEINLNLISSKKLPHFQNQSTVWDDSKDSNYLHKFAKDQKRNCYPNRCDRKVEVKNEFISNGNRYISCSLDKSSSSNVTICSEMNELLKDSTVSLDESTLGIVKLLKNWRVSRERYQCNGITFSDTRSSLSSINTSNDSDSSSLYSDISFSSCKPSRNSEYHDKVISSSHLIQLNRPENVPAKPLSEQMKHQKEYEKMVETLKRKERNEKAIILKKREKRLKEEEKLSQSTHLWLNEILPSWNQMRTSRKVHYLWWNGLPPSIRGKVWSLSMGNTLNITREKYIKCVEKSKEILNTDLRDFLHMNESYEHSVELIRLDISRTFPQLCIFQQGGPYYEVLHSLLGAYVCYQPEVGYVQGMSFIAAVLLLNMEELDAFICFANMLNKPCHKAFYSLDVQKMKIYYMAYSDLLRVNMYDLYKHVNETSLSPDLYLVDWVYTLFSKSMNLDIACRIWDLVFRDGENFIFRAALGIMHLYKNELLKMDFLQSAQYLTKLPDVCTEKLFKSISCIRMNDGSLSFADLLSQYG